MSIAVAVLVRVDGPVDAVILPVDRPRGIDRYIDYFGGPGAVVPERAGLARTGAAGTRARGARGWRPARTR